MPDFLEDKGLSNSWATKDILISKYSNTYKTKQTVLPITDRNHIFWHSEKETTKSLLTRQPHFHLSIQLQTNYKDQQLLHHQPNLTKHQKDHSQFLAWTSKALYLNKKTYFSAFIFLPNKNIKFHKLKSHIPSSFKEQHSTKFWNKKQNETRHRTVRRSLKWLNFHLLLIFLLRIEVNTTQIEYFFL